MTSARDGSGRLFVVEQRGRVKIVKDGAVLPTPFLDISDRVSCCGERGLLSIAFPPGAGPERGRVLRRLHGRERRHDDLACSPFSDDPDVASVGNERILLKIAAALREPQRRASSRSGRTGISTSGWATEGARRSEQQRRRTSGVFSGRFCESTSSGGRRTRIPPDEPVRGSSTARPEIWAYGLRNPWRFSFDRKTGDLWIGDVGQGAWEEVDFQPAGAAGGANYGWRVTEGAHCYNPARAAASRGSRCPSPSTRT